MGNDAVIQSNVNVSNRNDLNWTANITGDDAIDKRIDKHNDKLVDKVVSKEKDGTLESMMRNIQNGEGLTTEEHAQLEKIAEHLSPAELARLADKGKISQEAAAFLILSDTLKDAGITGDAKGRALDNFFKLPPDAQKYCIDEMSDRDSSRKTEVKKDGSWFGLARNDKIKHSEKEGDLSTNQQRLALFLSTPRHGPGTPQNFVAGNFESSRDALTAALGTLPGFPGMGPHHQTDLINHFHQLGTGRGGGDVHGPEHFKKMGFSDDEVVDVASLLYQVLADRVDTLDQQVRGYAEGVQEKNDELKTLNNAMTAVRAASTGEKKTDLSEVTFQDAHGKEVLLSDYLVDNNIIGDASKLDKKLDRTAIDSQLSSLRSKSDIISSESTQEMTKLQQSMDKYNQCTTQQTQCESKFNSQKMAVIQNYGR